MTSSLVRSAHVATNALHSLIYFAPETEQQLTSAGLKPGRMCYFAGRAAPMGAVSGGVVTATFYNFSPGLVARCIPQAWALTRLLGPEIITSPDMVTLAVLAREAARVCRPEGRPLYAGHADLDWPEDPHLVMWHALSLLREYRGDGHICALLGAGLSGLEALVTHTATGQGFVREFAQASRGWSDQEWKGAVGALTARGLLAADGSLTPAGEALRSHVEEETDRLDADPWQHLGDEDTEEVVRIGKAMTRTVMKAGAFPREGVFAR
jgi:hypothetical protein